MAEQNRIRVMTVDDHQIMRGGIKFTLLAFDDIQLVGEARSGEEALRVCGEVSPDVVLMDMKMPKMDGIATTRAIKATSDAKCYICTIQNWCVCTIGNALRPA